MNTNGFINLNNIEVENETDEEKYLKATIDYLRENNLQKLADRLCDELKEIRAKK
jgi:hypothetical protein